MKKVYMFLIGFIIIGVISFSLLKDTEKKNKDNQDVLTVSGVLETNEIDVNVKVGGKLLEIMVEEGDNVKKGDIIATVEAENIEAKLEQAKALLGIAATRVEQSKIAYAAQKEQSESQIQQATGAYSSAKAQLTKAKKGARPQQLEQAKELVVQAKEAYEYTKVTYDRLKKLYDENRQTPSKEIAGIMLSAIISDTLLFKSPTSTKDDEKAAKELAEIAKVDINEYGLNLS